MLVLSRRVGEQIQIGDDIFITVTSVDGHRVRIGIEAPSDVRIRRSELTIGGANASTFRSECQMMAGAAG